MDFCKFYDVIDCPANSLCTVMYWGCELDRFLTEFKFEFRRYFVRVQVQKKFFFEFEFAPLTVSLFINASWKEFWSLLILVLTDLYICFFNVL